MSSKKNHHKHGRRDEEPSGQGGEGPDPGDAVSAGGWTQEEIKTRWRPFPAPQARERLRVAFSREAYAELILHAKMNLQAEVCGVLAGEFCEDDEGMYVSVEAAIRGASAQHGVSHVTYTQETWEQIHKELEDKHTGKQIVGWYHSHPGFGVAFSDMDLFIQKHFFPGRGQIAFVTDPLGGEEAICFRADDEVQYLARFWVDARDRRCRVPAAESPKDGQDRPNEGLADAIKSVEGRLSQTLQALEALRTSYYRFLTFIGMAVALGLVYWISSSLVRQIWGMPHPPEIGGSTAFLPVPMKVNGEWRWTGVTLVTQKIDPDNPLVVEMERMQRQAERDQLGSRPAGAGGPTPASSPAAGPTSQAAPNIMEGKRP